MFDRLKRTRPVFLTGASALTLATIALFPSASMANPKGGSVVAGAATIGGEQTSAVTIDQSSDRAIIEWNDFSIDEGQSVVFNQPQASSITANRVVGQDPSVILGSLQANGQVVLINRNGLAFGKNSRVDVSGLVATTADLDGAAFMSGSPLLKFKGAEGTDGTIVVEGHITVANAGLAAFVAPHVRNNGVITADLGRVALAAGNGFSVDLYGDGLISFAPGDEIGETIADAAGKPVGALVENSGEISARGGEIMLTASAAREVVNSSVNVSGILRASSVSSDGGKITLSGPGAVEVHGDAVVDVSSAAGRGGKIEILGDRVGLLDAASLTATGATGGGEALVGGNYLGRGPQPNASVTVIAPDVTIDASAIENGAGGRVIVWSNDYTNVWGSIRARGGAQGGDGGFVETSSKDVLNMVGTVDAGAPAGVGGTWLLDPGSIVIADSDPSGTTFAAGTTISGATSTYTPGVTSTIIAQNIEEALANSNVFITTGGTTGDSITQNAAIEWNSSYGLTLSAGGDLLINNSIVNGGDGYITLLGAQGFTDRQVQINAGTISTQGGAITIYGGLNSDGLDTGFRGAVGIQTPVSILSHGGNITIANSSAGNNGNQAIDIRNLVDAGSGDLLIRGYGRPDATDVATNTVYLRGSVLRGRDITILADSQGSGANRTGLLLVEGNDIRATRDLSLTGIARGGTGTLSSGSGMGIATSGDFGTTQLTLYGGNNITLDGTATTTDRFAVDLRRTGTGSGNYVRIGYTGEGAVSSGTVTIKGTAAGTGGLYLGGQTQIQTTGDVVMGGSDSNVGQVIFGQVNFDSETDYGSVLLGSSSATLYNTPGGTDATDLSLSVADGLTLLTKGDLTVNYNITNTATDGDINILAAQGANGTITSEKSLFTNGGNVRIYAGLDAAGSATGFRGTITHNSSGQIVTQGGNITIANGVAGNDGSVRAAILGGTFDAGAGDFTVTGYKNSGTTGSAAVAINPGNITAKNVTIRGYNTASDGGGVRFSGAVKANATGNIDIYGSTTAAGLDNNGIDAFTGTNTLTFNAFGTTKLEGVSTTGKAIDFTVGTTDLLIGQDRAGGAITSGNISILGTGTSIGFDDTIKFLTTGDVTVGDNDSTLGALSIKNSAFDSNNIYRNITIGGAKTSGVQVTGGAVSAAATDAINVISFGDLAITSNFTNTAQGGDLGFYVAQGAEGTLTLASSLATQGGDITLYAGRDISGVENGSRGSLFLNSSTQANSIVTGGGNLTVANTSAGADRTPTNGDSSRGVDLRGIVNAGDGDITITGFYAADAATNASDVAVTLEQTTIRGRNITVSGQSLGTGANGSEGIRFYEKMDMQATGNISLTGTSVNARGIATWQSGVPDVTLYAAQNLTIEGVSAANDVPAIDFSRTAGGGTVRIGYNSDNVVTTGDISITGSATGSGGINMGTFSRIRGKRDAEGNGGNVTIGDNGSRLDNVVLYTNTINSTDNFGSVTTGGTQTRNIAINGTGDYVLNASGAINFIDYDSVTIARNITNTAAGGNINIRAGTGADGALQVTNALVTNGGDVTLTGGIAANDIDNVFKGSVSLSGSGNITTKGGDVTIRNSTLGSDAVGIDLATTIDTSKLGETAGDVTLTGYSVSTGSGAATRLTGATINAGNISIRGTATANSGTVDGIFIQSATTLAAEGDLSLIGTSNTYKGVEFKDSPGNNITLFAVGDTLIHGSTASTTSHAINAVIDDSANRLIIGANGGTVTQGDIKIIASAPVYGMGLNRVVIKSDGGDVTVGDDGSVLGQLNLASGLIDTTNVVGNLTLGGANTEYLGLNGAYLATNDVVARANQQLELNLGVTIGSTDGDIILSAEHTGTFTNRASGSILSTPNGNWLIYSSTPESAKFGDLASGNDAIWNQTNYDTLISNLATQEITGNRFAFASIPVNTGGYTVATTNQPNKTYGDTVSSSTNWDTFTIQGNSLGDNNGAGSAYSTDNLIGLFEVTTNSAGYAATANVGSYDVVSSGASDFNAQPVTFGSGGKVVVDPRAVTLTGSQVYDSTTTVRGASLTAGNLVNGDSVGVGGSAANAIASKDVDTYALDSFSGLTLDNSNYTLTGASGSIAITPFALELTVDADKVYDGGIGTTPSVASDNHFAGDDIGYTISASFSDKNVGTGKTVTIDDIVLTGGDADNYTVSAGGSTTADITRLASVTWTGGGDGVNWFDPGNWAGGAVPDLANVASVSIPSGVTITFDQAAKSGLAEAGVVELDTLGGTLDADTLINGSDAALSMVAGSLVIADSLTIDTLYQSGGAIGGDGSITITDGFSQTAGTIAMDGDITINQGDGDLSFVSLSGANVDLTSMQGSIIAGTLSATGDLDLTASEDVLFAGLVDVGGNLTVTADSDDDGTGGIGQNPGAALTVSGDTSLTASEDIVLDDPANDFVGAVSGSTDGNMSLADANDLTLGAIDAGGDLTLEAGDDLTFGGATDVGGNLDATADADGNGTGGIGQDPGAALTVSGDTSLTASEDIVLDDPANDFVGEVSGSTDGNMNLADANDLTLGAIDAGGDLTLEAGDDLTFGGATDVGGNLDATADANGNGTGGIGQEPGAALTVSGDTSLTASEDIVLDDPANDFVGEVSGSTDGNMNLADANDLTLGAIDAGGDLTLEAGDDLTFGGATDVGGNLDATADANGNGTGGIGQEPGAALTVSGDTSLTASEDIVLDDPANDFVGEVSGSTDGNMNLADANDLTLGAIDAGGDLSLEAGDDLTFGGATDVGGNLDATADANGNGTGGIGQDPGAALTVSGDTSLTASEDIVLDDPANDFVGEVSGSTDGNMNLADANDLTLGAIDAGGDLTLEAGNSISGEETVHVGGDTAIVAGGDVDLINPNNQFGGATSVDAGGHSSIGGSESGNPDGGDGTDGDGDGDENGGNVDEEGNPPPDGNVLSPAQMAEIKNVSAFIRLSNQLGDFHYPMNHMISPEVLDFLEEAEEYAAASARVTVSNSAN